ncbi:MAG: hypothetical protein FWF66_04255 [Candidatus Bathyarchaeota archaeon]|nr:hypothetical protein [Candidatus Termiticorpusculum sp.]
MNVKFEKGLQCIYGRKFLVFVSLLFMISLASFSFVTVFIDVAPFALGTSDKIVSDENELQNAINNAQKPLVIAFDCDIKLTDSLIIPYNKDITLTSNRDDFYKLIGADEASTITIDKGGVLRLEGIIVTHMSEDHGNGVFVNFGGVLYLSGGAVSNNRAVLDMAKGSDTGVGGGVFNCGSFSMSGGEIFNNTARAGGGVFNTGYVFSMSGGKIFNNTAYFSGGGVDNYNGIVKLYDGVISGNRAMQGGGVFNVWNSFDMSGGVISDNVADDKGGGVYSYYAFSNFNLSGGMVSNNTAPIGGGVCTDGDFNMGGGVISGNIATKDGGGVYVGNGVFNNIDGIVSGNTATNGNDVYHSNDIDGKSSVGGYSLRDVLIVVVISVVVVASVLFVYFERKIAQVEAKWYMPGNR